MQAWDAVRKHAKSIGEARARRRLLASRNPGFVEALKADVPFALAMKGNAQAIEGRTDLFLHGARLAVSDDAFLALAIYRWRAAMLKHGVPVLPSIAKRLSIMTAGVCIGDPVVVKPGVYLPHGQVVIDGITTIESGARIRPWVTIGLTEGNFHGPTIESNVSVGTGAKIFGPIDVGAGARIGANAVVISSVEPGDTVVGVPARTARRDRGVEASRTAKAADSGG